MKRDSFSQFHPAVNFIYFVGAIGFGVVIQHPMYILAGIVGAALYFLLLEGKKALRAMAFTLPLCLIICLINPIFNTSGEHVLFTLFDSPITLEALLYGAVTGGIFMVMVLWFGCYSAVLTSDKFTALFGNLIPSLSLLLVMVLRMIPALIAKGLHISGARKCIGKGAGKNAGFKEKIKSGLTTLSALTDSALEGSIITADSMRARGYGAAKRTNFNIYRFTLRDIIMLIVMAGLAAAVILIGSKAAVFLPTIEIPPLSWGFIAYAAYLLLPSALYLKETVLWHILKSRI